MADPRPTLIACRTTIGFGAPTKAGTSGTHGSALGAKEVAGARAALGWDAAPFEVPEDIAAAWRAAGQRGRAEHAAWAERLAAADPEVRAGFERRVAGDPPAAAFAAIDAHIAGLIAAPQTIATRKASELVLDGGRRRSPPGMIGGSADLTGSNNTKDEAPAAADPRRLRRPLHLLRHPRVRHGGGDERHGAARPVMPYGGTFLVFSDYCAPAIRLSALQQVRVIYVMTHDSASGSARTGRPTSRSSISPRLRAIPNLAVYRPADAVETAECWALALADNERPSVLALSRQNLPQLRPIAVADEPLRARRLPAVAATAPRRVVLVATGSEVQIAAAAAALLEADGIGADVVSMPCWETFDAQPAAYRDDCCRATR